jgi:hypothetical protein
MNFVKKVCENRVLRTFGPKMEVAGFWKRLHNEELHNLYTLPIIIRVIKLRRIRWVGYVTRMGGTRHEYKILVGKLKGTRPLGRLRCRWEDNIRMDLKEVW